MPLYEYACRDCGRRFEALRRMDDRLSPAECPGCGGRKTSLAMSAPGMVGAAAPARGGEPSCGMGDACCGGACGFSPN